MTELQKKALGVVIRAALVWLAAKINAGKIIPPDMLGGILDDLVRQALSAILGISALAWSFIEKEIDQYKLKVALVMPPQSSPEDLKKVLKKTAPGDVPTPQEAAAIVTGRPQG